MNIFSLMLLGFAVSMDGFIAGVAYGLKNIKMPVGSLLIAGVVTLTCTAAAMAGASYVEQFIASNIAIIFGSLLLISIGIFNLFQEYLAKSLPAYEDSGKQLSISVGRLVISIMAKPETADIDHSKQISPIEAVFLGLALGVDNMVAAFAAALIGFLPPYTPLVLALIQMIVLSAGICVSSCIVSDCVKKQFAYLPGILLVLLGLARLVP